MASKFQPGDVVRVKNTGSKNNLEGIPLVVVEWPQGKELETDGFAAKRLDGELLPGHYPDHKNSNGIMLAGWWEKAFELDVFLTEVNHAAKE